MAKKTAKAKQAAKKAATSQQPPAGKQGKRSLKQVSSPCSSKVEDASATAPKQPRTQTILESAERSLKAKFQHIEPERLDRMRNAKGEKPVDVVVAAKALLQGTSQNLPSKMWRDLETEFGLEGSSIFDSLKCPENAESFDPELFDAIQATKDKNPAKRNATAFKAHLEYNEDMNETEMYGCLRGCRPQMDLSAKYSHEMQHALLGYFGSALAVDPNKYPTIWPAVTGHFEVIAKGKFLAASALGRETFVEGNRAILGLFMDLESLDAMEAALAKKEDPSAAHVRKCLSTVLGSTLYAKEAMNLNRTEYIDSVKRGIDTLFHHDYEIQEVENFKNLMRREVKALTAAGQTPAQTKRQVLDFLGLAGMKNTISHANDEWKFRLAASLKDIGCNSGAIPRMPWEVLVYGDDKIPHTSEAMDVPAAHLKGIVICRNAALKVLGGPGCSWTSAAMQKALKPHLETLNGYDSTWAGLEWNYLVNYAEDLVKAKCQRTILDGFPKPNPKADPKWDNILDIIDSVKRSAQCNALPVTFTTEMTSLYAMVRNLQTGVLPERQDIQKFSDFNMAVLKATEVFCSHTVEIPGRRKGGKVPVEILFGKPALLRQFADVHEAIEMGETQDLNALDDLRRFAWLLDPAQNEAVDKWVSLAVQARRMRGPKGAILDGESTGADGHSASAASSASAGKLSKGLAISPVFAGAAASQGTKASQSKAAQQADSDGKARLAAMHALFGAKAVVK